MCMSETLLRDESDEPVSQLLGISEENTEPITPLTATAEITNTELAMSSPDNLRTVYFAGFGWKLASSGIIFLAQDVSRGQGEYVKMDAGMTGLGLGLLALSGLRIKKQIASRREAAAATRLLLPKQRTASS
jgi:hypothetical protein